MKYSSKANIDDNTTVNLIQLKKIENENEN